MQRFLFALVLGSLLQILTYGADTERLHCAVCKTFVDVLHNGIVTTTEQHSVQVRFRIDEKQRVPYARSEIRLMELLDTLCDKMDDYGLLGKGHERRLAKVSDVKGGIPYFRSGTTMKRELKAVCHMIRDEYEDGIMAIFRKEEEDIRRYHDQLCVDETNFCKPHALQKIHDLHLQDPVLFKEAEEKKNKIDEEKLKKEVEEKAKRTEEESQKAEAKEKAETEGGVNASTAAAGGIETDDATLPVPPSSSSETVSQTESSSESSMPSPAAATTASHPEL